MYVELMFYKKENNGIKFDVELVFPKIIHLGCFFFFESI